MITPKELRQMAKQEPEVSELLAIENAVTSAAKEGKTDVWYYKQLSVQMKNFLLKSGFKVNEQWDRNEYLVNISWEERNEEDNKRLTIKID
jgi:hypothetical protein